MWFGWSVIRVAGCGWVGVVSVLQAVVGLEWYPCCRLWLGWSGIRVAGCGWVGVVSVLQAAVGLEWYPCCRLKHKLCLAQVLGSMCVGISVWLGLSGIRVAGCGWVGVG